MKMISYAFVVLALCASALPARAATLVTLNKSEQSASLIDPETGKTITKLPVGRGPHELVVTPDGQTAFVGNFGRFGVFPPGDTTHTQAGNTITVLDLAARKVKSTFEFGTNTGQHGFAISRDGKYVWVTSETPQSLLEIDPANGKILNQWKTNQDRSHLVIVTPDEKKFYVTNTASGSVSVIDRASGAVKIIPVGAGAEGITIAPDGREVWVAWRTDNKISVIPTAKDEIVETFAAGGDGPQRLQFTPDGKEVWVSNVRNDTLTVFDAKSRKLVATLNVGKGPAGIVFSPDGRRGYFALSGANKVAVIDVAARKVVQNYETGVEPDGIALAR